MATLSEAFAIFDAVPTNVRYSWSALSRDKSRLICTLWQHEFEGKDYPLWVTDESSQSTGYVEHSRDLRFAIENSLPIVGFVVIATNPRAKDISVKEALVDRLFHLQVVSDTPDKVVGRIIKVEPR